MKRLELVENLVRLALAPGIGSASVNRLLKSFGTSDAILGASEKDLAAVPGMRTPQVKAALKAASIDPRPELDAAAAAGVRLLSYDDPEYPVPLLNTDDLPFLLYIKGSLKPMDVKAIGIVGTRHASRYGREQTERFSSGLARAGFCIISGLARGIDTVAHRGALDAGGRTIAVTGCGFAHVYPPENRDLLNEITSSGAVITEFSMDTPPSKDTFPRRNRIVAGMSMGLLVVEAPKRSGALITARQAIEASREVFAIPGRIDQEQSAGCHDLIRDGALLTTSINDIIEEFNSVDMQNSLFTENTENSEKAASTPVPNSAEEFSDRENNILSVLDHTEQKHIDQIAADTGASIHEVASTLMILELKGKVASTPGKYFVRKGTA